MKKLPAPFLGHVLVGEPSITPTSLSSLIERQLAMGLSGVTIVPAIIQKSWEDWQIVSVYKKLGARGLVCGFLPGDGPDPHKKDQMKAAANSLRPTFELAASLANAGFGQPDVCGPIHTLHRAKRTAEDIAMMDVWIYEELLALSKEYGTRVLFEPLNKIEDGVPDNFDTIGAIAQNTPEHFGIHWDTGHAENQLGSAAYEKFDQLVDAIGFLELVNIGRNPLRKELGINFQRYIHGAAKLPEKCHLGLEPFGQSVIDGFGLRDLCDTKLDGYLTLQLDIESAYSWNMLRIRPHR